MTDLNQPVILNQHEGLGLQYYDEEKGIFYPSLISMSIELTNRKEIISEEMRLIYVALTRAKEQLYLIGREKKEERLEKLTQAPIAQDKLTALTRFNAKNPFELIYSVFSKFDNQALIDALRFKSPSQQDASLQPAIEIKHIEAKDILPTDTEEAHRLTMEGLEQQINKGGRDRATTREIEARLLFEYPYQSAQHDASKQSVSELKRQLETEQADTNYDRVRQYRLGVATYNRPQFLEEQKRTAAEIGTLMHTVMQHLPFRKEGLTEEELNAYIDTLVQRAIISEEAINDIQRDDVMRFINSGLYQRIAESDEIYRELPFIVNQHDLESETHDNDAAIIQGMIDVVYVEEGTYHFVDYKTDAFVKRRGMTDDEIGAQLKEKYRIQMQYYKKALETITGQHVSGYLYFFKFGALVID